MSAVSTVFVCLGAAVVADRLMELFRWLDRPRRAKRSYRRYAR